MIALDPEAVLLVEGTIKSISFRDKDGFSYKPVCLWITHDPDQASRVGNDNIYFERNGSVTPEPNFQV